MRRVVTAGVYKSAGMKLRTVAASLLLAWHSSYNPAYAADLGEPVPIYSEAELIKLIEENKHLERVKADNCQIVEDIVARATRISLPSYEFLYGDMLAWGVCVDQDVELGLYYMENAAHQGLPAALEQLGRYYSRGTLVQQDKERAIPICVKQRQWAILMRVFSSLNCYCVITAVRSIMKMPTAGCITRSLPISVLTIVSLCCVKV